MRVLPRLALLLLLALLSAGEPAMSAQVKTIAQKKVLVLHLMRKGDTSTLANERVYQQVLTDGMGGQLDYYSEYVDLPRFGGDDYQSTFRNFLKEKYAGTDFDVIIAAADLRNFLRRYSNELFAKTPVVFAMSDDALGDTTFPPNFTGITYETNLRGTLDIIRRMQPAVRRVFVVSGASQAVDQWHEARAKRQFKDYGNGLEIIYLSGLPIDELRLRLSNLTPDSVVYFLMLVEDGAGRRFATSEGLDEIASASSVPIYTWYDGYLGHGTVGGQLASSERVAGQTAKLALRILRGERVETISISRADTSRTAFDWRQLERWKLDEDRLPAGAEVLFREASIWQRYKHRIVGVIALLTLQSVLIVSLLIERRRRRKASLELEKSEREFSTLVENSPDVICRLSQDLRYIYVSPKLKDIFAVPSELFPGTRPGEVAIPDYDWRAFESTCREAIEKRQAGVHEFQYRGRHYRTRIIPEYSSDHAVQSLLTITEDFTERRQTELELEKLSGRLITLQDEERRRIARELHDGTVQNIAMISLNLRRIEGSASSATPEMTRLLGDSQYLAAQCLSELRTISYLLHPPILDMAGLARALEWLAIGFSERSGIRIETNGIQDIGRLPVEIETALFRIAQESLTNIHRHSGSDTAQILLQNGNAEVTLQISDHGHGMPTGTSRGRADEVVALGVGISGMRQRLTQLGGRLEIQSSRDGTTVTSVVPAKPAAALGQHSGA